MVSHVDTEEPTTQPTITPTHMPLAKRGPFALGEKIPVATWIEVERDCVAGMTAPEASKKWGIKENTIRIKAKRNGWIMPNRVRDVLRNHDVTAMTEAVKGATTDWLAKGEKHREKVFDIATQSLKTVKKVRVKNAKDFEIMDKAARRAAGLESGETQIGVLIQMHERMENFEDEQPIEAVEVEAVVTPVLSPESEPETTPQTEHTEPPVPS